MRPKHTLTENVANHKDKTGNDLASQLSRFTALARSRMYTSTTLEDGLSLFKADEDSMKRTLELEQRGQEMVSLVEKYGDSPDAAAHRLAHRLLVDIESWKAMCMRERMKNAIQNSPAYVWAAFYGVITAKTDLDKISAVMCLKGFGSSVDEDGMRGTKVASSVLRFFYPEDWVWLTGERWLYGAS